MDVGSMLIHEFYIKSSFKCESISPTDWIGFFTNFTLRAQSFIFCEVDYKYNFVLMFFWIVNSHFLPNYIIIDHLEIPVIEFSRFQLIVPEIYTYIIYFLQYKKKEWRDESL